GQFLGFCVWLVSGKYRRLARRNIAIAFANEKTPREMHRLVRRHFQRLGANLLCSVKFTAMPPEKILRRVKVDNIEAMDREFRAGVPVVLVLSHLGIWELFAQLMPKFVGYVRNASVYQKLCNRFIDPPKAEASVVALTAEINQIIEQQIRVAPEDWFWVHNRWKTPQPNFLLAQYKRGVYVPPGVSPQDLKPFQILIRSSNWLGDSVMSVPAVRAIKAGRPDARVTIAAPEKIAPMWKLVPEVDAIISLSGNQLLSAVWLLRRGPPF